jgi:hypothetical protein
MSGRCAPIMITEASLPRGMSAEIQDVALVARGFAHTSDIGRATNLARATVRDIPRPTLVP